MSRRMVALLSRALSVAASVLALTPGGHAQETAASGSKARPPIGSIREIADAMRECWVPPLGNQVRQGMKITDQCILKGNGEVISEPRITYVTEGAPGIEREAYRDSIVAAFVRCGPFPLSAELRRTIVGKLLWLQFVDNRKKNGERSL